MHCLIKVSMQCLISVPAYLKIVPSQAANTGPEAKKAILYDPNAKKILDVAP